MTKYSKVVELLRLLTSGIPDLEILSVSMQQDSQKLNFSKKMIQFQDHVNYFVAWGVLKFSLKKNFFLLVFNNSYKNKNTSDFCIKIANIFRLKQMYSCDSNLQFLNVNTWVQTVITFSARECYVFTAKSLFSSSLATSLGPSVSEVYPMKLCWICWNGWMSNSPKSML